MIHLIFFILCICKESIGSIEVKTKLGRIRGEEVQDKQFNVSFYAFRAIRYAEPPVGVLRFKPPVPKTPWNGVYHATIPGYVCPQPELFYSRSEMNEDCLTFNVYTPTNFTNGSFPVILNIHGGDFNLQSGNADPIYGPQLIVGNNIITVTVNHRIGVLGFFSMSTASVPGNNGLRDLILALKVIKENIAVFGGDPNKITLRGNGAGACMAQYMMLTNQTVGLFQNVLVFGGSVLSPKYIQLNPRENALTLARELELDTSNDDLIMAQLALVDPYSIIRAQEAITRRDPKRGVRLYMPFKPTVEVEHENAVLTKTPFELMTEGAIRDLTVFIGFNTDEGLEMLPLLLREPELIDKFNANFELVIPEDIQYPPGSEASRNLASQINNKYFDGGNMSLSNIKNITNLISDLYYTYHVDLFVKLFKEKKKSPVYYSIFAADTELNWFKAFTNLTVPGAAHSDNIGYAFVTSVTRSKYPNLSSYAKVIQNNNLRNLLSISSTGAPPGNIYPEAGPERYHTISTPTGPAAVYSRPYPDRTSFWDSIYGQYRSSLAQSAGGTQNGTVDPGLQANVSVNINVTSPKINPSTNSTIGLIPAVLGLVGSLVAGIVG